MRGARTAATEPSTMSMLLLLWLMITIAIVLSHMGMPLATCPRLLGCGAVGGGTQALQHEQAALP
jgi:hypothetical protein